ncbi:MAG: dienelactone hydrolase family protein [Chlorobia bacterium]|nr:dienelactone hydrolase family protein [Fimbriimonadaceae bacterium]
MGSIIKFSGGDREFEGYLSEASDPGPGVIVFQEWWGLVDHIKDVCDRFAAEGITALAPDLYFGEATTEPTRAGELMMALNISETAEVVGSAIQHLLNSSKLESSKVGVVGFCMGGQLAVYCAANDDRIGASVNFYGIHPKVQPSYRGLSGPMLGIFAEHDEYGNPEAVRALSEELTLLEKPHHFETYPGTKHAFFNDDRPEVYNEHAAKDAWQRTIAFLKENL